MQTCHSILSYTLNQKYSFQNSLKKYNAQERWLRCNTQVHTNARKIMSNIKNVERYARIVDTCTGLGEYAPGQEKLQPKNLLNVLGLSRMALSKVNEARTGFEKANEDRKKVFGEIQKLAPRIVAELKSSGVSPDTLAAATAMVRKISGRSASVSRPAVTSGEVAAAAATTTPPAPARPRTNGRDYASVAHHFEKLLQTVASEPLYQPQTTDLQLTSLQNSLATLQSGNAAVSAALARLGQARRDRDAVLYSGPDSLFATAMAVKNKVRAIFGANSAAAHAVTQIVIEKPKGRK